MKIMEKTRKCMARLAKAGNQVGKQYGNFRKTCRNR